MSGNLAMPRALVRGVRRLRQVTSCEVTDDATFDPQAKRWVVPVALEIGTSGQFVPRRSLWKILVDDTYPFGRVDFYPSANGGIGATFPHQDRNTRGPDGRAWREGKLCLDSPFRGERYITVARDPVGDGEERLAWHVKRALAWLQAAAAGELMAKGDPFEVPSRPLLAKPPDSPLRVVHDESATTFGAWHGRAGFGIAKIGLIPGLGNVLAVGAFLDGGGALIREWTGRSIVEESEAPIQGFWWLWAKPVVVPPWMAPTTWGDLRRIGRGQGIDVDQVLRCLAQRVRGRKESAILLVGYPVPVRVGDEPSEVHWDAVLLPKVAAEGGKPPAGFRPNARGWWMRDRYSVFSDKADLAHLATENWSVDRLQARGRLPESARTRKIAVLGVGSLGSVVAELLVRAGVTHLALVDNDTLSAGNVCRHTATLAEVGNSKVDVVARRLMQISPHVQVVQHGSGIPIAPSAVLALLDPYDVLVDCTASSDALEMLSRAWWPVPRLFLSASVGHAARRFYSFAAFGNAFPVREFCGLMQPWLAEESAAWAEHGELLEGAGCWSPLFPARYDDVLLAASVCVKEIERLVAKPPLAPILEVFERLAGDSGFQSFSRVDQRRCDTEAVP